MIANLSRINFTENSEELTFVWDQLKVSQCPSIEYKVDDNGCGLCKRSPSENVARCTNVDSERGQTCTFLVYTDVCGDRVESKTLTVNIEPSGKLRRTSYYYCACIRNPCCG